MLLRRPDAATAEANLTEYFITVPEVFVRNILELVDSRQTPQRTTKVPGTPLEMCYDFRLGARMPRATRVFEEGRICHVYNRVGGGLAPFADEKMAQVFVDLFREVAQRDTLQILGWSLLGNHYHLIIRQGPVEISRPMKTLQQRTTRARNLRDRVWGSLWQGRFKAKDVTTSSYLMQLIAYVHLYPVKAGLVDNPTRYRWSGHRDIIGLRKKPIVAIDEALLTYGETRRRALKAYRSSIDMVSVEEWSREGPGQLPWWSLGRPTDEERLKPKMSDSHRRSAPSPWTLDTCEKPRQTTSIPPFFASTRVSRAWHISSARIAHLRS